MSRQAATSLRNHSCIQCLAKYAVHGSRLLQSEKIAANRIEVCGENRPTTDFCTPRYRLTGLAKKLSWVPLFACRFSARQDCISFLLSVLSTLQSFTFVQTTANCRIRALWRHFYFHSITLHNSYHSVSTHVTPPELGTKRITKCQKALHLQGVPGGRE
jgi:hypothetical protein